MLQLEDGQHEKCRVSCQTKEYKTEIKPNQDQISHEPYTYSFAYKFELANAIRDGRSRKPFKTVESEYYLLPLMTLIGNVGGTLGMFVGFSIIAVFDFILGFMKTYGCTVKKPRFREKKRHSFEMMTIERPLIYLIYSGLLAAALLCVQDSFKEHMNGISSYSSSKELITPSDLPTITICLDFYSVMKNTTLTQGEWLVYGNDFAIDAHVYENFEHS